MTTRADDNKSNSQERDQSPVRPKSKAIVEEMPLPNLAENSLISARVLHYLNYTDAAALAATNRAWSAAFKQLYPVFIEEWLQSKCRTDFIWSDQLSMYERAINLAQAFRMASDGVLSSEQFVTLRDDLFTSEQILHLNLEKLAYQGKFLTSLSQGLVTTQMPTIDWTLVARIEKMTILWTMDDKFINLSAPKFFAAILEEVWRMRMPESEVGLLVLHLASHAKTAPRLKDVLTELAMQGCSLDTLRMISSQWSGAYDSTFDTFPEAAPLAIHPWKSYRQINLARVEEARANKIVPNIYECMLRNQDVLCCAYNQPEFVLLRRFPQFISLSDFVRFYRSDFPAAQLELLGLDHTKLVKTQASTDLPPSVWLWILAKYDFKLPSKLLLFLSRELINYRMDEDDPHVAPCEKLRRTLLGAGMLQPLLAAYMERIPRALKSSGLDEWNAKNVRCFLQDARIHSPPAVWTTFVEQDWGNIFQGFDYRALVVSIYSTEMPPLSLLQYTSTYALESGPKILYYEILRLLAGVAPPRWPCNLKHQSEA